MVKRDAKGGPFDAKMTRFAQTPARAVPRAEPTAARSRSARHETRSDDDSQRLKSRGSLRKLRLSAIGLQVRRVFG